jgi:hypothetical protein
LRKIEQGATPEPVQEAPPAPEPKATPKRRVPAKKKQ